MSYRSRRLSFFSILLTTLLSGIVPGLAPRVLAQQQQPPEKTEKKVSNPIGTAEEEAKALRKLNPPKLNIVVQAGPGKKEEELVVDYDRAEGEGDTFIYTGNVEARYTDVRIFANRVVFNDATKDVIAEGDVYFEQQGQTLVGERLEFNLTSKKGTMYQPSGFTDRTPDGSRLLIDASRADKISFDTYVLDHAVITACQERVPKWSFTAKRARIKLDDKATVYNGILKIKNIPVFYLPYVSLPISKRDRSSGFLLPTSGSSNIKGRTLHNAYYQTLGQSADILFRSDFYSERGFGTGFDFRARTDEKSKISIGSFLVFDRLWGRKTDDFGNPLPDQGGSSFYVDAVQYFKNGFVAVADVNITSSFDFRQVFAEDIQQAISPEERSLVYLNRNWNSYTFNASFGETGTFVASSLIKTRALPSFELNKRSTKVFDKIPLYFAFDSAAEGVRRTESQGTSDVVTLKTPSVVQRIDFAPRAVLPLPSLGGFLITPSIGLRSTFYSDSLDPVRRQVVGNDLWRLYGEFAVDVRPPALGKTFRSDDGSPLFKHIIEPYFTYRKLEGIDDYDKTIKFDEKDVIADTNEVEYGITNRILVPKQGPDGTTPQAHELLDITIAQKYFFDPTFGGALQEGVRNQFFPINTLSGFAYGGVARRFSPLNLKARYRPTGLMYADLRMNYDIRYHQLRDILFGGGITKGIFSVSHSWSYTRRVQVDQFRSDPSTLPGNIVEFSGFAGNPARGPYGGVTVAYDLRERDFTGMARDRRLINLTTTAGWAWDCCGIQLQNVSYDVGLRNENRILFAFTFKGIGTFGTENFGQRR